MARTGVQYEDVQRAIESLMARGEAPSVQKIREVLGTGSFTTISDHLREWRQRRAEKRDEPLSQAMPDSLTETLAVVWKEAQGLANESLVHYRHEADKQTSAARESEAQSQRRAEDAEQRLSALSEQLAQVQARLEERVQALATLTHEREHWQQHQEKLEKRLTLAQEDATALERSREHDNERHQQALQDQDVEWKERLVQEESRHEASETRLMKMLDDARLEKHELDKQHRRRQEQLEKRIERLDAQTAEQRKLLQEEERRRFEEATLRQQRDSELKSLRAQLEHSTAEQSRVEAQLVQVNHENRMLQERLSHAPLPPFVC
ncbi:MULTISPECIES: DNA-binding protein [Cobetia]|uniref:DNA-binding protein n=1 Tax=Cobetia TaxID=204286 RepID=UPI0004699667|nr:MULTISPECIES: DNA-binding protein [Cobetia]